MAKLDDVIPKSAPEGWRIDWRQEVGHVDIVMYVSSDELNVSASYERTGTNGKPFIHTSMSRKNAMPSTVEVIDALNALFPAYQETPRVFDQVTGLHPFTIHVQVPL